MKNKKWCKIFLPMAVVACMNIHAYAATAEETAADHVPPVFDSGIQTRYVVQRAEDGSKFEPQEVITDMAATDDVDGKDVTIKMVENTVDLSTDGQYYVSYSATDKAGNESFLWVTVLVDGTGPVFADDIENLYYINQAGIMLDSNYNVVKSLPKTLTATDSVGAYAGIGVCIVADEAGNIVFADMIDGSPAAEILKDGDILIGIDGEDVRGQTPAYVAAKIKGKAGTDVALKLIRDGEEMTVAVQRQIVKLYEDEEFIAEPTVELDSIERKADGVIEITYVATDEAGNTTEFVVRVVEDKTAPVLYINGKRTDENEAYYRVVTTGDMPPEDIDFELPVVTATDYDVLQGAEATLDADSIKVEGNVNKAEWVASETPYAVTYTATDAVGNEATFTVYVTVEEPEVQPAVDTQNVPMVGEEAPAENAANTAAAEVTPEEPAAPVADENADAEVPQEVSEVPADTQPSE